METWERRTEWPLAGLALIFLAAYAWPILDPSIDAASRTACSWATWTVWVLFALDYVVRLTLAENRRRWVLLHVPDLLALVLPVLRPLRLLRLVALLRVVNRSVTGALRGQVAIYVTTAAGLLAFVAALAGLDAERGRPGANITSFGDSLWWAITTMTTVGYGDRYPVTTVGRLIAVGLMVAGIAVLGTVTATLASWLVDTVRGEARTTDRELAALRQDVARLTSLIERASVPMGRSLQPGPRDDPASPESAIERL